MAIRLANIEEPPYDTSGRGTPVTGMMPRHMPMFWKAWKPSQQAMPAAASRPKRSSARIAIGNGGIFGQGLFNGSQTKSGFVPEQQTDFIFTVAGEELGLVGSALLIALLGVLLWRALRIAMRADDLFGRVAAAGIACWFGFQAFQNIGMCLGIMPVTGVPLPLVSYGGSSMFAGLMAIGLLQNIHLRSGEGIGVARSRLHRSRF